MRWGRIVGLAFALEAALFAALLPIQPLMSKTAWVSAVTAACGVFGYVAGRLVARGLTSGAAMNGLFVTLNALRIVGCVAGAVHAQKKGGPTAALHV